MKSASLLALGLVLIEPIACVSQLMSPPAPNPHTTYRVGAPDKIRISSLPEPKIERILTVRPDGKVSLDLIGDVEASGLTTEEIAESARIAIGRYKSDASVTVTVIAAESDTISLFGEVRNPGTFAILHDIRIAEAIAQLGGIEPPRLVYYLGCRAMAQCVPFAGGFVRCRMIKSFMSDQVSMYFRSSLIHSGKPNPSRPPIFQ
jgi:polysaccharide export outer membrane protein